MRNIFFLIIILSVSTNTQAQFVKINKKALRFLTSEDKINVLFVYNNLLFNSNNLTESQFLSHINEKITHHKDSVVAKKWEEVYFLFKTSENQKTFVNTLNTYSEKYNNIPRFVLNDDTCQYTLKVDTNWMYYGYDAGVMGQPAKLTLTISFSKTLKPDEIIDSAIMKKVNGSAYPDEKPPKPRIKSMQNSYKNAAHELALTLKKIN